MSKFIPNKGGRIMMTERQFKRKQERVMKNVENKLGEQITLPTEEEIALYIKQKTGIEWQNLQQEEKQTN